MNHNIQIDVVNLKDGKMTDFDMAGLTLEAAIKSIEVMYPDWTSLVVIVVRKDQQFFPFTQELSMAITGPIVFGSLLCSCLFRDEDWYVPRRLYHAALAVTLLIGYVVDHL